MGIPWKLLEQHQGGFLQKVLDLLEVPCTECAIDDPVVTGKAEVHAQAGNDLTMLNDRLLDGGTDREDQGLWWVNDRVKGFDSPCTEIGDSDGAAVKFIGLEFLLFGTGGEILDSL